VSIAIAAGMLVIAAGFALVRARDHQPAPPPELATYMAALQHHTHKLNLSIQAENAALAGFYLREVEEASEQIEQLFPEHDGFPVAALVHAQLDPRLAALNEAIEGTRWDDAQSGLSDLIAGCNGCHAAAAHGFIKVEVTTANPFNQSFTN
jgi:hypothetical protein